MTEKQKAYYEANKEKISEYKQRPEIKERRRKYLELNKEKISNQRREYRQKNKEKISFNFVEK